MLQWKRVQVHAHYVLVPCLRMSGVIRWFGFEDEGVRPRSNLTRLVVQYLVSLAKEGSRVINPRGEHHRRPQLFVPLHSTN